MRTFDAAALAAFAGGRLMVRNLLTFDVQSGLAAFWDDVHPITIGGQTYEPMAGGFTVSPIPSVGDMSVQGVEVVLSPLTAAALDLLVNEVWHQRDASCGIAIFDASTRAILDSTTWFRGVIDQAEWREQGDGMAQLVVRLESLSRELDRRGSATRSDVDQRRRNVDDGFFRHVAAAVTAEIYWGRNGPQVPPGRRRGRGGVGGDGFR